MEELLDKTFMWCEELMVVDEILLGGYKCIARSLDTDMIKHFDCSYVSDLIEKQTQKKIDEETKCGLCGQKLKEEYQVKVCEIKCHSYDPVEIIIKKCCSEECASALKEKNCKMLKALLDEIQNQEIQKIK